MLLAVWLLLPSAAGAVTPQTWWVGGVEGWQEAQRESVTVTSEGEIALGWGGRSVEGLAVSTVWALLPDGNGVLAGTGDEGRVFRVSASGRVKEVARVIEPQVTALGRDAAGRVWLGTAPDGTLYRLEKGKAVPVADTPETYVWAVEPWGKRGVVVATGHAGKLYRWDEKSGLSVLADLGAEHATGLAVDGGTLLVTTESPGRLLRVDGRGRITVLHDGEEPELRAAVPGDDGVVYFLANPSGEKAAGRLYRRTRSGAVERLWTAAGGFAYDLDRDGDGVLWVTTGSEQGRGTLVRVSPGPPAEWVEMLRVGEPQVLVARLDDPEHRWVGTGGVGHVYRLPGKKAGAGKVTSKVHDAGGAARWGAAAVEPGWTARGVGLEVRSGNTRKPDSTWSAWRNVSLEQGRGVIGGEPARFLQWRLTLSREETRVEGVRVRYLPANAAPRVNQVTVTRLGAEFDRSWDGSQPASLSQDLPGGVHVEFQVPSEGNGPQKAGAAEAAWARRYRVVNWEAEDPNHDDLRFTVEVRAPGEDTWKPAAEDLAASPWIWDSSTVPDGWYRIRVVASDRRDNPPGEEETAFRVSRPVLVDNTPPVIRDLAVSDGVLTGRAEDRGSTIRKLFFSVDGKEWTDFFPEDGIADMPVEKIRVKLDALSPGDHVILVRAMDQAGNLGSGRLRFRVS